MRILLVEDDAQTAGHVARGMASEGYEVDIATTGPEGLTRAIGGEHDVIILDRMLPGVDGLSIVKSMRAVGVRTPVLYLTAMSGINDRVEGLEGGADDYLIKPFAFAELLARVRALGRRPAHHADDQTQLTAGGLKMDLIKRTVRRDGRELDLLPQEFRLLEYLMRNQGRTVTRTMLLGNVWDMHFDPRTNVVESHVSRLRSKLNPGDPREIIQTVRNVGYVLRAPR
ncbi:MAG: response regulator transcription factor [Rhodospirillaceae bacterium]|nr:response regulator transcription factor [Rhodospirillaceae bacterium]